MVIRQHLLDDFEQDFRLNFVSKYITNENASPKEQAVHLREYAQISKSHQKEVINLLNSLPAVCLASTRNALPKLATFAKGEKERKNRFDLASGELFRNYSHVYADLSTKGGYGYKKFSDFPAGLRRIALTNLLTSDHVKEFILDVSFDRSLMECNHNYKNLRVKNGSVNISTSRSQLEEEKKLPEILCKSLEQFSERADKSSFSFGLKCMDQPFKKFLVPLAQTLADCREGLGAITSLDIGSSFSNPNYSYERRRSIEDIALENQYADNLSKFIRSNKNLQNLSFGSNAFNNFSALLSVIGSLKESVGLVNLNLSGNYLMFPGGEGEILIKALIDSLRDKPSLRYVDLAGCDLGDYAADLLETFLQKNPLVKVCISENSNISHSHPIYKLKNIEAVYE